MKYVIVKDADDELVCFGPDDGMYEPVLTSGQTRHVVDELPEPSKKQKDAVKSKDDPVAATRSGALQKLATLGLTEDEIELLFGER